MNGAVESQRKTRGRLGPMVGGLLLLVVTVGLALWGISTRARALSIVTKETRELAVPTVSVIKPDRGAPKQEVVLPGTMQAFADAPIYARTNGYLSKWYVDIGARVRRRSTSSSSRRGRISRRRRPTRDWRRRRRSGTAI
jgi:multidrug efflux pump subunit AcrA (membrane-fusion protein)